MDTGLKLNCPWHEVKERLKENDIRLTDDDLDYEPGKEHDLLDRLSKKLNKSKREIKEYIESVAANDDKSG